MPVVLWQFWLAYIFASLYRSVVSTMPSKNVVLNSFQRVEYVDRLPIGQHLAPGDTTIRCWKEFSRVCPHHNKVDYVYGDGKSHANFDRPTMTVTNNTHNSASKSHIINNVKPMALSGSTTLPQEHPSILKVAAIERRHEVEYD